MSESGVWRSRLRRWRWLLALIVLALVVRVALPEVIRRVAISQASANLRARVDLGNVDLYLWRGGIVLEDFALRPLAPGEPSESPPPAEPADAPPPIVAWKKLALGVSFRPLWHKTIQLYEVGLESPQIALDRLADGQLNLMSILPLSQQAEAAASPVPTPAASVAEEGGWRYGIDHLAIGTGKLVFRDLMVEGSEPVEVGIPSIDVRDIALDPQVYGGPLNSKVKILLDEGSIEIGAKLALTADSTTLDAELEAQSLPLRRSRLYVPDVGWSDLRGLLDASLHYQLETGAKNELRGKVTVRDVSVSVPDLPEAALYWKSLSVSVDPIDLVAHSAHVAAVDLDGAVLTVQPTSANQFPVLERAKAAKAAAAETAAATPGATPAPTPIEAGASPLPSPPPPPAAEVAETVPWRWSVDSLALTESLVRMLRPGAPLDLHVDIEAKNLADQAETPAKVDLRLGVGDGTIQVQGEARVDPPGFGGKLAIANLSVPELIAAMGVVPDSPLLAARLDTDLAISAGLPAPGATGAGPQDLKVSGRITVGDARIAPPGMKNLDVGVKTLVVVLAPLDLPGMLAFTRAEGSPPPAGKGDLRLQGEITLADPRIVLADGKELFIGAKNIRVAMAKVDLPGLLLSPPPAVAASKQVALGEVKLEAPVVRVTRTETGIVLPGPQASPAAATSKAPTPAAEEPKAAAPAPAAPSPPAGPPPLALTLASFQLTKGKIDFADRAVKPPFNGGFDGLDISARDVRWPDLAVKQLKLKARTGGSGEIAISGDLSASGGEIQFDGRKVDLPSYNPYAASYSPFKIGGGALSLSTKMSFKGTDYEIGNSLTLHQLDLTGREGESLFEQNFGVPLSTALALLRDAQGDIAMDIPLKITREGTQVDIWGIAGGALRAALVNALTSPLRLLGAVTGSGDKVASMAPAAIPFRLGRAEPAGDGDKRLEQVGTFLADRPTLAVELAAQPTQSDVRWLREQALLATWDEEGLLASMVAKIAGGDTRERIQQALQQRAADEAGKLSEEDAKTLDEWLAEQPQIEPSQIEALGQARLALAQAAIGKNVEASRVVAVPVMPELSEGDPQVSLKLKSVGSEENSDAAPKD